MRKLFRSIAFLFLAVLAAGLLVAGILWEPEESVLISLLIKFIMIVLGFVSCVVFSEQVPFIKRFVEK